MQKIKGWLQNNVLYIAWVTALSAMLGSLYFSEVLQFTPCVLCWWQRIFMYPLVIIIAVGIVRRDRGLSFYVLPLSIPGALVGFYHTLLNWGIIPESLAPCKAGVSCTTKYVEWLGFINIPFLSTVSFIVITLCMLTYLKINKNSHEKRS